jgi:hypothetical protein
MIASGKCDGLARLGCLRRGMGNAAPRKTVARATSWRGAVIFALIAAFAVMIAWANVARAAEIDPKTPCAEFVAALDGRDFPKIRAFSDYVLKTMDELDMKHMRSGQSGIMAQLSDDGRSHMVPITSVHCRDNLKMTVHNSAAFVYTGIREMQMQLLGGTK